MRGWKKSVGDRRVPNEGGWRGRLSFSLRKKGYHRVLIEDNLTTLRTRVGIRLVTQDALLY